MRIKKGIVLLVAIVTLINYSNVSFAAKTTRGHIGEIISNEKQRKIDELYEERLNLCMNYDKNQKAIDKLDKSIEKLGAVEVTLKEVEEKMKMVSEEGMVIDKQNAINVKVPRESYVKWTSTRRIVTYNGTQYEIQELRAVPTSSRSSLYGSATVKKTVRQNVKAKKEFLKSTIPTIMGMAPNVVGTIGNGLSIYQACRAYDENLSNNVTIEEIEANSTITVGTDYIFDYVKKVGYKDEGHQVLCYAGNNVSVAVSTVIPTLEFKVGNNEYTVSHKVRNDNLSISSPKISNRYNTACSNYIKYLKGKNMNSHYNIQKFKVRLLAKTKKTVWVPKPNYGF